MTIDVLMVLHNTDCHSAKSHSAELFSVILHDVILPSASKQCCSVILQCHSAKCYHWSIILPNGILQSYI